MVSQQLALHKKKSSDWRILLALFLVAFFTRISLINWYTAEYTDGIHYITFYYHEYTHIAPLYGSIIQPFYNLFSFIPTHEIAGRFISILAGSLSVIPLFLISRYLFTKKVGAYSVLFYIVSPVALRWNIRVMTDSLFTLFFLLCIYSLLKLYYEPERRWFLPAFFLAGMAALTRYQGLALVPLVAFLWVREIRCKRYRVLITAIPGILPWLAFCWWIFYRKFGQVDVYRDRMEGGYYYLEMFTSYLSALPYALTYPVFALFCYGLYRAWKVERGRVLVLIFAALFLPWLFMHVFYRELVVRTFMPLFPLAMVFAAYASTLMKREKAVMVVCLVVSIAFSAAVLYYQRDTFGDVKRAAEWVRYNVRPQERVYTTSISKTVFWTQRPVKKFVPGIVLRPGDYVVLNSFYVSIPRSKEWVGKRFYFETVYETTSTIVPLLPDLTNPAEYTNAPGWHKVKFRENKFKSVVLKVGARK
jgi:4-amino-4-deoxy-L-arabinose transferase-like glycosyltransferase